MSGMKGALIAVGAFCVVAGLIVGLFCMAAAAAAADAPKPSDEMKSSSGEAFLGAQASSGVFVFGIALIIGACFVP